MGTIVCLMVKRDTNIIVGPGDTGPIVHRFLHRWLGAGTTSQVGISADRSEIGATSGEIMVERIKSTVTIVRAMTMVRGSSIASARA